MKLGRALGERRGGRLLKLVLPAVLVVLVAALAYRFLLSTKTVSPHLSVVQPIAVIGEGEEAVGVSAEGAVLTWQSLPGEAELPRLPLAKLPVNDQLAGPMLAQARVLGAAPAALRPYVEGSYFGESGVDVNLRSGIELRFGDASRAAEKWRAAATVLADPSITALDYVDLHAPRHPSTGGEGHPLPPVP